MSDAASSLIAFGLLHVMTGILSCAILFNVWEPRWIQMLPTDESELVVGVVAFVFGLLGFAALVIYGVYNLVRVFGRGVRDIREHALPRRHEIPKAKVVK